MIGYSWGSAVTRIVGDSLQVIIMFYRNKLRFLELELFHMLLQI
jgi:hypothetical protein